MYFNHKFKIFYVLSPYILKSKCDACEAILSFSIVMRPRFYCDPFYLKN